MTKDEIERARQAYVSGVREGRDNRASGLGLGLPIVISSIESVGGTFQIDSRAGEGTRCSIEMAFTREDPLLEGMSQEKEKESAKGREREKLKKSCKTIAIVDDVEMIRLGAADVLENQGHRVLLESDGERGLEMLKQNAEELDLALVDIQMPKMSGDELIVLYRQWELAERPGKRRLRIYACTGNATSTDSAAYMRAGFDGCISKPVYPQTFKALLSSSKLIVQSALVVGCQHSHFSSGSSNCSSSDSTPPSPGPRTSGEWSTASPKPSPSPQYWGGGLRNRSAVPLSELRAVSPSTLDEIRGDDRRSASGHRGRLASGRMPAAIPGQSMMRKFSKEPHGKPVGGMNTLLEDKAVSSSVSTPGSPIVVSTTTETELLRRSILAALPSDLSPEVRERALEQAFALSPNTLAANDMMRTLGYSSSQAEQMLIKFRP